MLRGLVLWCVAILVPATVSRAETPSREPVAVAYLSSLDGTLNDVEYIVTAGGRPELATMIRVLMHAACGVPGYRALTSTASFHSPRGARPAGC